jgi:5-(carboxyamino)imidazole ribonucleotide synthase
MNYLSKIGIVGGGQLGRMLTISAKKMGFYVAIIDPTPNSPAGQVADRQIVADYKDSKAILELSQTVDVITFEIELADDRTLLNIMKKGKPVNPSPFTLSIIKDKLKQKEFLAKNKIPTAEFFSCHPEEKSDEGSKILRYTQNDILNCAKKFGYPFLMKARSDAYDGRGNFVVKNKSDIQKGLDKLKGRNLYAERFVKFKKELAVMVAKNTKGETKTYPVVETIHKDNICDTVIAPANISSHLKLKAKKLAEKVVKHLKGAGVFGIEMFLDINNDILINEIAPRVHNSGHYTIEGCITSQFEQHIRAITGLPLGSTSMLPKAVVMKNILGQINGRSYASGIDKALGIENVSVHIYGKKESRLQRKMGHITVVGNSVSECLEKTNTARRLIKV